MTQATMFHKKSRFVQSKSSSARNPSVTFETNARYLRKNSEKSGNTASPNISVGKKSYLAPDATVIIAPSAIERAAVEELISETPVKKKGRINFAEIFKDAVHKESEIFDEYGVETKDIFTEEINLDIGIGATVASRNYDESNIVIEKSSAATLKVLCEDLKDKFRDFAGKVYKLRIG